MDALVEAVVRDARPDWEHLAVYDTLHERVMGLARGLFGVVVGTTLKDIQGATIRCRDSALSLTKRNYRSLGIYLANGSEGEGGWGTGNVLDE